MTEAPPHAVHNLREYTVGEISQAVKLTVEESFGRVRVRGEISNFRRPRSGHLYFDLKDENAVLSSVCWRGIAAQLSAPPEDGLEVICTGRLTTFPGQSRYQILVEQIEPAGKGALLALLEERRKKLAAEGLFDEGRKQKTPYLPEVIGVVTSPTGAVVRDILHRIADRFPRRVLIWPASVQGVHATAEIVAAIEGFNRLNVDGDVPRPQLLIVARGGGSLEDLWAFNETPVVRAVVASAIPIISAVGHETDTTLIDFAADRRAPTPTAAAEMAVPVRADLLVHVNDQGQRLFAAASRYLDGQRKEVRHLARGLQHAQSNIATAVQRLDMLGERLRPALVVTIERRRTRVAQVSSRLPRPQERIAELRSRLSALVERLCYGGKNIFTGRVARLETQGRLLESCGYQQVLDRGFVLARGTDGAPVTSATQVSGGMGLMLTFKDGERPVIADSTTMSRRRPKSNGNSERQGRLF